MKKHQRQKRKKKMLTKLRWSGKLWTTRVSFSSTAHSSLEADQEASEFKECVAPKINLLFKRLKHLLASGVLVSALLTLFPARSPVNVVLYVFDWFLPLVVPVLSLHVSQRSFCHLQVMKMFTLVHVVLPELWVTLSKLHSLAVSKHTHTLLLICGLLMTLKNCHLIKNSLTFWCRPRTGMPNLRTLLRHKCFTLYKEAT